MSRQMKRNAQTLVIGLIIAYGLAVSYQSGILERRGTTAPGIVTHNWSRSQNADYNFVVGGRTYQGAGPYPNAVVGRTIPILYLPENPTTSVPDSYPLLRSSLFLGVGILFLIADFAYRIKQNRSRPRVQAGAGVS